MKEREQLTKKLIELFKEKYKVEPPVDIMEIWKTKPIDTLYHHQSMLWLLMD